MPDIYFFDNRCRFTNEQNAQYRVEIVKGQEARFFEQDCIETPFYCEIIQDLRDKGFPALYLSVLLKAVTESPY